MKELVILVALILVIVGTIRGCQWLQAGRQNAEEIRAAHAGAAVPMTDEEKRDPEAFGKWFRRNVP